MITRSLTIMNSRGLHARASARFVQCAEKFDARIQVARDGQVADGTSIMGLMMLAAASGSTIEISAEGAEADVALEALEVLVGSKFGEED